MVVEGEEADAVGGMGRWVGEQGGGGGRRGRSRRSGRREDNCEQSHVLLDHEAV